MKDFNAKSEPLVPCVKRALKFTSRRGFNKAVGDGFLGVGAAAVNPGKLVLVVV